MLKRMEPSGNGMLVQLADLHSTCYQGRVLSLIVALPGDFVIAFFAITKLHTKDLCFFPLKRHIGRL